MNFKIPVVTPCYTYTPALLDLQKCLRESESDYEVFTWGATLLKKIFSGDEWLITPGKRYDKPIVHPDFFVEKFIYGVKIPWLIMMQKCSKKSMERTLRDALNHISITFEDDSFEIYVIVQIGTEIGFFIYHRHHTGTKGCHPIVIFDYYDRKDIVSMSVKDNTQPMHLSVGDVLSCVFNLDIHRVEINCLFDFILKISPAKKNLLDKERNFLIYEE
jgi:hypothetical protein